LNFTGGALAGTGIGNGGKGQVIGKWTHKRSLAKTLQACKCQSRQKTLLPNLLKNFLCIFVLGSHALGCTYHHSNSWFISKKVGVLASLSPEFFAMHLVMEYVPPKN